MTDVYAQGIRLVDASTPGAELFTNPHRRNSIRVQPNRPGVDKAPQRANPAYGITDYLNSPGNLDGLVMRP